MLRSERLKRRVMQLMLRRERKYLRFIVYVRATASQTQALKL